MTLAIDGTAGVSTVVNNTIPTMTLPPLTTSNSAVVIILHVVFNTIGVGFSEVTSVSSPAGLIWTRRKRVTGLRTSGTFLGDAYADVEIWWAVSASPLTADPITVHITSELSFISATAFGVAGANTTTPWDTNVSLPASTSHLNGPGASPTVSGVSTDSANTMVLFFYDTLSPSGIIIPAGPPGFSLVVFTEIVNAFIGLVISSASFKEIVAAPLVSVTLTSPDVDPGLTSWVVIADALVAA